MSERLSRDQNIESESEKAERESLIEKYNKRLEFLESNENKPTKEGSLDAYHISKIYFEEAIRILKSEGVVVYNKWYKNNYLQNLRGDKHGTIHLSEYARKNNLTNTEFLREHLLARAQGEAVKKEIEKEKEKADK